MESGRLAFDGDVEEGIRYLQYDDDEETDDAIDDAELGADI
jgi:ABC-2 type transport system ATP-binding protein